MLIQCYYNESSYRNLSKVESDSEDLHTNNGPSYRKLSNIEPVSQDLDTNKRPLYRVERLNVVYPIVCGLEDCFDQLDQWKSTTQTDSLWLGELNGRPVIVVSTKQVKSKAEVSKDWAVSEGMAIAYLTPEFPTPLERPAAETRYFSNIAGVFNDPSGAQKQLATVQEWAPNAFISLYKGKYYVVSADYEPGQQALQSKAYAVENGVAGAWLLPEKLYPIVLPNLSGAPDLIVYFKFDKYDVMDKYQQQIDDVIAKLPTGVLQWAPNFCWPFSQSLIAE